MPGCLLYPTGSLHWSNVRDICVVQAQHRLFLCFSTNRLYLKHLFYWLISSFFFCQCLAHTDTPQFRGGNQYFFCENLYQSVILRRCIDVSRYFSRDSYSDAVCKKIATLCNKYRQPAAKTWCYRTKNWSRRNWSFTSRGPTVADIGQSKSTGDEMSCFSEI